MQQVENISLIHIQQLFYGFFIYGLGIKKCTKVQKRVKAFKPNKHIKVKYSLESISALQRVVEFVENRNSYAARRIALDLQEGVERLKQFPLIGLPVLKASNPEQFRDLYVGDHTLRYLITDEIIYILRSWYGKENEKNL